MGQLTKLGHENSGEWAASQPGKTPGGFLEEGGFGSNLEDKEASVSCSVTHETKGSMTGREMGPRLDPQTSLPP